MRLDEQKKINKTNSVKCFSPEKSNAVIQGADQDVRVTVSIHVHPSIDRVAESLEASVTQSLTFDHLQGAASMQEINTTDVKL